MIQDCIEPEIEGEARVLANALIALADTVDGGREIALDGKTEKEFADSIASQTVATFGGIIRDVLTARDMADKIPHCY